MIVDSVIDGDWRTDLTDPVSRQCVGKNCRPWEQARVLGRRTSWGLQQLLAGPDRLHKSSCSRD